MNKFFYQFKSIGEKIYEEGLSDKFSYYEILCLYRYCKFELNMKPAAINKLVISQYKNDYFPAYMQDVLSLAEKKSKMRLISDDAIVFKGNELDFLKSIDDRKIRKIVFGMFSIAKVEGKKYYNYKIDFSSRVMNARMKKSDMAKASYIIDKLIKQVMGKGKNSSWLIEIPEKETSYLDYFVEFSKVSTSMPEFCEGCESIFKPKNNRQIYCDECKIKKDREKKLKWWKNNH
jgi:hypothetical protein